MGKRNLQNRLSQEQAVCAEPVYLFHNAVGEYNNVIRAIQKWTERKLPILNGKLSNFNFIRRGWKPNGEGYFHFTYFDEKEFSPAKKDQILGTLRRSEGILPNKSAWGDFLERLSSQDQEQSRTLKRSVSRVREWTDTSENPSQKALHHHLLQLYSRFEVQGFIPEPLYSEQLKPSVDNTGGSGRAQTCQPAFLTYTLSPEAGELPDFEVFSLPDCKSVNQHEQPEPPEDIPAQLFANYLAELFQNSEFRGDRYASEKGAYSDDYEENLSGRCMLWIPVYEQYRMMSEDVWGCPAGFFLGWLFQEWKLERRPAELFRPLAKVDSKRDGQTVLERYIRYCLMASELVAKEVQLANERDTSNAEFDDRSCAEFIRSRIHHLGNWVSQPSEGQAPANGKLYSPGPCQKHDCLTLALNSTEIDLNPVAIEDPSEEEGTLHLELGGDFAKPPYWDSYLKLTCGRIRSLYHQLLYRKSEAEQRAKARLHRKEATEYGKISDSVKELTNLLSEADQPLSNIREVISPPVDHLFRQGESLSEYFHNSGRKKVNQDIEVETIHDWKNPGGRRNERETIDLFKNIVAAVIVEILGEKKRAKKPLWNCMLQALESPSGEVDELARGLLQYIPGLETRMENLDVKSIERTYKHTKAWFADSYKPSPEKTLALGLLELALSLYTNPEDVLVERDIDVTERNKIGDAQVPTIRVLSERPIDTIDGLIEAEGNWGGVKSANLFAKVRLTGRKRNRESEAILTVCFEEPHEMESDDLSSIMEEVDRIKKRSLLPIHAGGTARVIWKMFGESKLEAHLSEDKHSISAIKKLSRSRVQAQMSFVEQSKIVFTWSGNL